MGYPRFRRARAHKHVTKTAGSYSITSTTWLALDTTTDLTLEAQAGDVIQVSVSGRWNNAAVAGMLTAATLVGATLVDITSGAAPDNSHDGVGGWYGNPSISNSIAGGWRYTLTSADISSGLVTIRFLARCSAATKTLYAITGASVQFQLENLGPVDPN